MQIAPESVKMPLAWTPLIRTSHYVLLMCASCTYLTENFAHYFWWSQTDWTFFVGLHNALGFSHKPTLDCNLVSNSMVSKSHNFTSKLIWRFQNFSACYSQHVYKLVWNFPRIQIWLILVKLPWLYYQQISFN